MKVRVQAVRGLTVGLLGLLFWLTSSTLALADASYLGDQCIANALASGTPDVITIPLLPCSTNTNLLLLTASAANATTTPTLQQIGGTPALTIVKANGGPLAPGDIAGAGYIALLTSTGVNWVLMNPATTGGGGSLTVTDGTHTVGGVTTETFTNSTVGGTTPSATVTVPTGFTLTDGTHTVTGVTTETVSGGTVGGTTPNGTLTITGGGGSGITFTDGTHTVAGTTQLTITGGTIGGTTPNGTLLIVPGGQTYTDGVHTVTAATQLTTTGLTIGGTTPNATAAVNYATNSDVWSHTSTGTAINPAVAATSTSPQTFTESGGTFSVNFNLGINLELPLVHADCPCTIANPTNVYAGLSGNITLLQSATGSDTVGTWGTTWKFSAGVKPTLTTTANAVDVLPFYCRTTTFCVVTFIANAQ